MGALIISPYYLANSQFFMNGSNIVTADWKDVSSAFSKPLAVNSTTISGYDWTKPYPSTPLYDHSVNLTLSRDMTIPEDIVQNSTTVLSSLTFGTPAKIMVDQDQPKAMDKSWYVCRHVFISTKPEVKETVDNGGKCSFLPNACQSDLKTSLTQDWGKLDGTYMCGSLTFDPIPSSCIDSFGFARQDVMPIDKSFFANATFAPAQASSQQHPYSWRMGTGYHGQGSSQALAIAANRTYLVATVWGYSSSVNSSAIKRPDVSLACLSSGKAFVPTVSPIQKSATQISAKNTKGGTVGSAAATKAT